MIFGRREERGGEREGERERGREGGGREGEGGERRGGEGQKVTKYCFPNLLANLNQ